MLINEADYKVRLVDLPYSVGGFITSTDGFFNIYINARHSQEEQKKSLQHELNHAEANDLQKDWDEVSTW